MEKDGEHKEKGEKKHEIQARESKYNSSNLDKKMKPTGGNTCGYSLRTNFSNPWCFLAAWALMNSPILSLIYIYKEL